VRLVDDLPSEDRLSVFRLNLHPFEGYSVPVAELASHHYAVECPLTLAHHLSIPLALSHTPIRQPYEHVRSSAIPNILECMFHAIR
jgi:hypothetical protein